MKPLLLTLTMCLLALPASAKYSGGSGTAQDPYQIATAADLIALGEDPNDYDKHFLLTADIDLDPNLPGRKIFDKPVMGEGWVFTGVFDGGGHTISHLTIEGKSRAGLFDCLDSRSEVRDLGVADVNIYSSSESVSGLVAWNSGGNVIRCYSSGVVVGEHDVGGLVGYMSSGTLTQCHSTCTVRGTNYWSVGGLVGDSQSGYIRQCYSTGAVTGKDDVGGLVGSTYGGILIECYTHIGSRQVQKTTSPVEEVPSFSAAGMTVPVT